jgi:hypothetical protein
MGISRFVAFVLYYGVARHLPVSARAYAFGAVHLRNFLARRLLDSAGDGINV